MHLSSPFPVPFGPLPARAQAFQAPLPSLPSVTTLFSSGPDSQPNSASPGGLPSRPLRIGLLGATGAVGQEMLHLLQERQFPVRELRLLASPRSAGQRVMWGDESLTVEAVDDSSFQNLDLVLASAGGSVSRQWAPRAVANGAVVIDNSSAFRLDSEVPLVVPEVNPEAAFGHRGVIANPNCTTILLTLASPTVFVALLVVVFTFDTSIAR